MSRFFCRSRIGEWAIVKETNFYYDCRMYGIQTNMIILGIETSCDETAAAVIRTECGGFGILSNIVSSQVKVHAKYGGVVPEVAARLHIQKILPIIELAIGQAHVTPRSLHSVGMTGRNGVGIDAIAVCAGPGLMSSLMVGVETAKSLAYAFKIPLVRVNHLEGHLLSAEGVGDCHAYARNDASPSAGARIAMTARSARNDDSLHSLSKTRIKFPAVGLVVSGGHTQIYLVKDYLKYKLVGETVDDAAGEAFDKVAKMLELGYPGGEIVERLAKNGKPIYQLPIPMLKSQTLNFSFSGLKTAAMYFLRNYSGHKDKQFISDFCASFQFVLIDSIRRKLEKCLQDFPTGFILCGGGVMNNLALRKMIRAAAKKRQIPAFFPEKKYNCDNAAMIAIAGFSKAKRGEFVCDINKIDRRPNWEIDE